MKTAIVTGASSGIGRSTATMLANRGFRVFGLSRTSFETNGNLSYHTCDLNDVQQMESVVREILDRQDGLDLLINNAGIGVFGPHEELELKRLQMMLHVNFVAPIILTKLCLRSLKSKRGMIINIGSTAAFKPSPVGSAYAATKAGLRHFGESLFQEVRKAGVRVITVNPDMTETPFYESASFETNPDPETQLQPEEVANAIDIVIRQREGSVITELTLKPQRFQVRKK